MLQVLKGGKSRSEDNDNEFLRGLVDSIRESMRPADPLAEMRQDMETLQRIQTAAEIKPSVTINPVDAFSLSIKASNAGLLVCDLQASSGFSPVYASFGSVEELVNFIRESFRWVQPTGRTMDFRPDAPPIEANPAREITFD